MLVVVRDGAHAMQAVEKDAHVAVKRRGDRSGNERENVADRLPRVVRDALVGESERVLRLGEEEGERGRRRSRSANLRRST